MKLTEMRVNQVETPMGFQSNPLSFSWKVEEAGNAKKQKSVKIRIMKQEKIVFEQEEEQAGCLDYKVEIVLTPRTRYDWSVWVTADNGEIATASSWFETGKMQENWLGNWIVPTLEKEVSPVLKKEFYIEKEIEMARLYICGLGVYECYINGKKVGEEYLAPGYHSYDFHLQAQTYDVTDYLQVGNNEINVLLGDGWFKGRLGFDGGYTNLYGEDYYLVAELWLNHKDKTTKIICTDDSWKWNISPIIFSNIYDGEIYDARLEEVEEWKPVQLKNPSCCGALTDRYSLPIVKKESRKVVKQIQTPKNELVLDFGQNMTGWVEFSCHLPKGEKITLTASEIMQKGCFYHENLRTAKTEFTYISNGKKAYVRPHFTFYGFRYMKVDCNTPISIDDFVAYHLRSDFDQIGEIVTGNKKVNQLFSNALWSQKDNFLDVPTDCPQRDERLGWTGDAQIFSETACYNMYMPAFYRKYLWDMRAEQKILDGSVPNVVPRIKKGIIAEHGSCPWADAAVIIPWNVYLHYGSKTLLKEMYPGMRAWIDYERKREEALGGEHLIKEGFHFADWLALDNEKPEPFGATNPFYIASAYYYKGSKIVSMAAKELGYEKESMQYLQLSKQILDAIKKTYFKEDGTCIYNTQTGLALAIEFELMEEAQQKQGEELKTKVEEKEGHLDTGFVGTPILCPALTKTGYHKMAVDLLLKEDFPSWLYSVNLGATTIWERWNSLLPDGSINPEGMNSLNHYSYGSIIAWMYRDICGIYPDIPGFKRARICPHPDRRLGFVNGILNTASGIYQSNWKYKENGKLIYELEIPFQASAIVTLPEGYYNIKTQEKESYIIKGKELELPAGRYEIIEQ